MSQDIEPSLTEYARYYGLTIHHLEGNPLAGLATASDTIDHWEDGQDLFRIDDTRDVLPNEKFLAGKDEALLLGSIMKASQHISVSDEDAWVNTHRIRNRKVELPLLATDHESDMQAFAYPVVPDLANEHLPLESLDVEADEGLMWPSGCWTLPDKFMREAKKEELEVSVDVLRYLQASLFLDSTPETQFLFEGEVLNYVRHILIEPMVAPLLPMSPTVLPYEPSSDTGHLELLSERSTPTRQELEVVDHKLFEETMITKQEGDLVAIAREAEAMLPNFEDIGSIYSPLQGIEDPPSSRPTRKPPTRDIKVEVPLTPPQSDQAPPWKRKHVSFSEALHEIILELPSPMPTSGDISSEDIDRLFAESIGPVAARIEHSIEQEQLQEADTMHRVAVPVMDFSLPVAPWKASNCAPESAGLGQSNKQLLLEMKRIDSHKNTWPNIGATERSLKWMPFPAVLGRIETYETIPDDGVTNKFLAQPECVDSNTLIWKRDDLRIFIDLEDPDWREIGYGTFTDNTDIVSLLRKRKMELEQADASDLQSEDDNATYTPQNKPVNHDAFRKVPRLSPRSRAESPKTKRPTNFHEEQAQVAPESFSAMSSLHSFMSLRNRGATESKSTAEQHFRSQPLDPPPYTTVQQGQPGVSANVRQAPCPPQCLAFVAPKSTVPKHHTPFVVSTTFLLDRKLARRIQQLYSMAEFIERDFTLHSTSGGGQSLKPEDAALSSNTMADEADMILSPSSGLILTTLQKIKQRALPGQVPKSAIRERIRRAAPRYERVLIVVGHDLSELTSSGISDDAPGHLDEKDCEALIDFAGFCSSVQEEAQIILAAGSQENLAQWIVSLMVKYGLSNPEIKLLQDETLWEVFLRRAGLNAFAAQAILSGLKRPDIDDSGVRSAVHPNDGFGLSTFIKMSLEERLARFKLLLGGGNVLSRTSRVLDAQW